LTKKAARKVIFPENKTSIEQTLLERPNKHLEESIHIQRHLYNTELRMAFRRNELPPLTRTWHKGETEQMLKEQHRLANKL